MKKTVWVLACFSFVFAACDSAPSDPAPAEELAPSIGLEISEITQPNESLNVWFPDEPTHEKETPPDVTTPDGACETDGECEAWMGSGACWAPRCEEGKCVASIREDGSACEAGACVVEGSCVSGSCIGTPKDCGDENPCTSDQCDPATGFCHHFPIHGVCEDGDLCTKNDICVDGGCVSGKSLICDDGAACNGFEACDQETGDCVATEVPVCGDGIVDATCGETCDDGNLELGDGCDAQCEIEPIDCLTGVGCDDNNPCTTDSCGNDGLCEFLPSSMAACDDGDACTLDDVCAEGACVGTTPLQCDDGLACTVDTCDSIAGCSVEGDDGACDDDEPCTVNLCDVESGCLFLAGNDGIACDDGNPCTTHGACAAGQCEEGSVSICDDGDPCTLDTCGVNGECTTAPATGTLCDDGDPCTAADKCEAGTCTPGFFVPAEGCVESYPICELTGAAGDAVSCMLNMARESESSPVPVGLQFNLQFPRADARLLGLYDEICFGENGCHTLSVTGGEGAANALSSGHTLILAPDQIHDWNGTACSESNPCGDGSACIDGLCEDEGGFGSVLIMNFSDLFAPVTEAYLAEDAMMGGDPNLLEIRFELERELAPEDPEFVKISAISANDASSQSLPVNVSDGLLISGQ